MDQYLNTYAEPGTSALEGLPGLEPWQNVLVIPACNETAEFLRPPPGCGGRSLLILVINESVSAPAHVSKANQALAATVRDQFEPVWQAAPEFGLSLFRDRLAARDVLLVDRFSDGRRLPLKGGVGHARKIGADLAAGLIRRRIVHCGWIHCSDADVQLPETYFSASQAVQDRGSEIAALIYPFRHDDEPGKAVAADVLLATRLYEFSLRYYVAGMQYAGSPYAFHTIGSTMAVSASHYARVRGFPRRAAGEDFYLLNKLAKVGSVLQLDQAADCEPIVIAARRSERVPFGTGAAVNRITAMTDPEKDFKYYHPGVFALLRLWLQSLPGIWLSGSVELTHAIFPDTGGASDQFARRQALLDALAELKTQQALEHAFTHSKTLDQFARHVHTWFDAFRSLKLIHGLRDKYLPSISYAELVASDTFIQLQAAEISGFLPGGSLR